MEVGWSSSGQGGGRPAIEFLTDAGGTRESCAVTRVPPPGRLEAFCRGQSAQSLLPPLSLPPARMAAPRPSSSDLSFFFPKSKHARAGASNASASSGTRVVVVQKAPVRISSKAGALQVTARSATPASAPPPPPPTDVKGKRKSPERETPRAAKKQRVATPSLEDCTPAGAEAQALAPRPSRSSSATPSESLRGTPSSRHHSPSRPSMPSSSRAPSRSRSPSAFPTKTPPPRECWTEEDGTPGPSCLTSEDVVRGLMKTYKACSSPHYAALSPANCPLDFKNPIDPTDQSFEPHPERYPVVELEYPNTGASEKYGAFHAV